MKSYRSSFTAADAIPIKLLQNHNLIKNIVENKTILPLHVQLIPTNKCNLKCSFCSCSEDDRDTELTLEQASSIVNQLRTIGTESVTITGGGEPLKWQHLDELISRLYFKGIKSGLVTNGVLLHKQNPEILKLLSWCRISQGDTRENWTPKIYNSLSSVIDKSQTVCWAFSYVVSDKPNVLKIKELLQYAEKHTFTHVRIVSDLLSTDKIPMKQLQESLTEITSKTKTTVIFQDRKQPEKGKDCRVCYLRPVIAPDMNIYACCGAQYALAEPTKNFPSELCLGDISDLQNIIKNSSQPFNGAKLCEYCYYGNYNRVLDMLMSDTVHREFI